jgi:DNA polymerase I-like protein with 3'-5' exonuclease and polymerase domains
MLTTRRLPRGPNYQNIPIRTEEGRRIKEAFMGNTAENLKPYPVDTFVVLDLRQKYGQQIVHLTDVELCKAYDDWKASHSAETFLEWVSP